MRTIIEPGGRAALPRPAGHTRSRRTLALAVGALGSAMLLGCDGGPTIEGVVAPISLTTSGGGLGAGIGVGGTRGAAELLGSWTRISSGAPGVLIEQTYTFLIDGSGVRTTVTRTALGIALAVEQAPFSWEGGGGVLLLRFRRQGAFDTAVRVPFTIRADFSATVLQLDGLDYRRSGG